VARLWPRYEDKVPSRAPIILGINQKKYKTICIYLKKSSDVLDFFEGKGCKVFYISKRKFFRTFNLLIVWKLVRILKEQNVDILHCHKHQAAIYGAIAAKIAGGPVVLSHVHGLNRTRSRRRKLINSFVLKKLNKILTVGEVVRNDVLKNNHKNRLAAWEKEQIF